MKMREAHDDGQAAAYTSIALDMLRDNEPMEKIIKYSHLTEKRIMELAQEIYKSPLPPSVEKI